MASKFPTLMFFEWLGFTLHTWKAFFSLLCPTQLGLTFKLYLYASRASSLLAPDGSNCSLLEGWSSDFPVEIIGYFRCLVSGLLDENLLKDNGYLYHPQRRTQNGLSIMIGCKTQAKILCSIIGHFCLSTPNPKLERGYDMKSSIH